jgi:hypothetical protein
MIKEIEYDSFRLQLNITTIVLVLLNVGVVCYEYYKYSGVPYKSNTYAVKLRRLAIIFFIWSICLIIKSVMSLSGVYPRETSKSNDNFLQDILIFVEYVITEITPYVLVLEGSFL